MLKVNNEEQAKLYEKRLEKVTKKLEEKLASMKTNTDKLASAEKLARKSSKLVEELEKKVVVLEGKLVDEVANSKRDREELRDELQRHVARRTSTSDSPSWRRTSERQTSRRDSAMSSGRQSSGQGRQSSSQERRVSRRLSSAGLGRSSPSVATSPNLQGFFNFQRDWRVYQQLQVVEKD
jgi:hypothetical protein